MPRGYGERSRVAKLMVWKNSLDVWHFTLWVPFHGQWPLVTGTKKTLFDRKINQMIKAFPGIEVEYVDKLPNVR